MVELRSSPELVQGSVVVVNDGLGRPLPTFLELDLRHTLELPERFQSDDVRYPEELVAYFVEAFTDTGDVVFDPFAGFGTTMVAAERLGRQGWGLELDPHRHAFARGRLTRPNRLIHGDATTLGSYRFPAARLCMTSPPYSHPSDPTNALDSNRGESKGYASYLTGIRNVFAQVANNLTADAMVVIEVSNLKIDGRVVPLAWDIAETVSQVLTFTGEIVIGWKPAYGYGYDHSYCLTFQPTLT